MSKNMSIFLIIIFFLVAATFGSFFWNIFQNNSNGVIENIESETDKKLQPKTTAPTIPTAPSASATNQTPATEELPESLDEPKKEEPEIENKKDENLSVYRDKKDRFEFKYPQDSKVSTNDDNLVRISQDDKNWKLKGYQNKNKYDLQKWYNETFSEKERKNCTFTSSTLRVGTYETKYINQGSGNSECNKAGYFAISSDKKNIVRIEIEDDSTTNVNEILETFKFENDIKDEDKEDEAS